MAGRWLDRSETDPRATGEACGSTTSKVIGHPRIRLCEGRVESSFTENQFRKHLPVRSQPPPPPPAPLIENSLSHLPIRSIIEQKPIKVAFWLSTTLRHKVPPTPRHAAAPHVSTRRTPVPGPQSTGPGVEVLPRAPAHETTARQRRRFLTSCVSWRGGHPSSPSSLPRPTVHSEAFSHVGFAGIGANSQRNVSLDHIKFYPNKSSNIFHI